MGKSFDLFMVYCVFLFLRDTQIVLIFSFHYLKKINFSFLKKVNYMFEDVYFLKK